MAIHITLKKYGKMMSEGKKNWKRWAFGLSDSQMNGC
jgi:hypothetical protein